jgi:hypothetical protein
MPSLLTPRNRHAGSLGAPPVYRPQHGPLQAKSGLQPGSGAPPVYRPQSTPLQLKAAMGGGTTGAPPVYQPFGAKDVAVVQRRPASVVQLKCRHCGMGSHSEGSCPFAPTVGWQIAGSFGGAVVNNIPSNIGTFLAGFGLRGGNPRTRLLGGLAGLAANLGWGTMDNYYNRGDKTTLVWHNRTGRDS